VDYKQPLFTQSVESDVRRKGKENYWWQETWRVSSSDNFSLTQFCVRLDGVRTKLKRDCPKSKIDKRNPWRSRRHIQLLLAFLRVPKCFNNACGARFLFTS